MRLYPGLCPNRIADLTYSQQADMLDFKNERGRVAYFATEEEYAKWKAKQV